MHDGHFVMGIDVGTGGVRAIVVHPADGSVLGTGTAAVTLHTPRPGWSEQCPDDWWSAACMAIGTALKEASLQGCDIAAIGLTGQMHGCTMVDEQGDALGRALLWNDQRATVQCGDLNQMLPDDQWRQITGKPPLCGLTLPSLLWAREHDPKSFKRLHAVMLPKDFLRLRLTGEIATDVGDASGTMLLDLQRRSWSSRVCQVAEVDEAVLPMLLEGDDISGEVTPAAATLTGLAKGTPVIAGGGDQQTGGIACGITKPGMVSLNLGTSGVLFAARADADQTSPKGLHAFCHSVPNAWHVMGVMLSAGGSLRWWGDATGGQLEHLVQAASSIPAGAGGAVFLPYLSGERTPHEDPTAHGAMIGLQLAHTQAHLTRAVMEGVCFGLRDGLDLIRGDSTVASIRITGGATASPHWRRMLADVLDTPLVEVSSTDGSAFGAAVLATVGAGLHGDVHDACKAMVQEVGITRPGQDARVYDDLHAAWRTRYPVAAGTGSA